MQKHDYLLLVILLTVLCYPLLSVNHMDMIQTMAGENIGNEFGASLVSMDYNGDGYDDLIVKAPLWHPTNQSGYYWEMYGKVYFYWGGPAFDNIPDFVIEGQHAYHLSGDSYTSRENPMICGGDMNGDGIDDLVIPERTADNTGTVSVYFGRQTPHSTPDIELYFPYPDTHNLFVYPLGDINGDMKADIAIITLNWNGGPLSILIWTNINAQPIMFRQHEYFSDINGVGDVNGDGYSDFVHYTQSGTTRTYTLFYGDSSLSFSDSLVVATDSVASDYYSTRLGDVNNDGINDFMTWNYRVWLGGDAITSSPDILLQVSPMTGFCYGMWPSGVSGDFNHDGYSDLCGADCWANGNNGEAGVWLGGAEMNGVCDLTIWPPTTYQHRNFGWSKAAGDFNGDGCCDLALGAPIFVEGDHWNTEGKVFVYAGNAQLADTTVANNDPVAPKPDENNWEIGVFPNPKYEKIHQNVRLIGGAYERKPLHLMLCVYNIKGQVVYQKAISPDDLKASNVEMDLPQMAAGIYILAVKENGVTRFSKKVSNF